MTSTNNNLCYNKKNNNHLQENYMYMIRYKALHLLLHLIPTNMMQEHIWYIARKSHKIHILQNNTILLHQHKDQGYIQYIYRKN